jgi:hypothetical protein
VSLADGAIGFTSLDVEVRNCTNLIFANPPLDIVTRRPASTIALIDA